MTTGQICGAIAILLVAGGIVLLNDKLKSKKGNKSKTPKKNRHNWKFLVCVFAFMVAIFIVYATCGEHAPNIIKWPLYGFVGIMALITGGLLLFILFTSRKALWVLFKSLCSGKRPHVMHKDADGNVTMRCPTCSGTMLLNQDENRFKCSDCEETATFAEVN
jgi:ribosomal protein S27AE